MPIPQVKINMSKGFSEISASEVVVSKTGNGIIISNEIASKQDVKIVSNNPVLKNIDRTFQLNNPLPSKITNELSTKSIDLQKNGSNLEASIPKPKQDS